MSKRILFQTIQLSVSTVSMPKAVPFQTIQFSISTQFSSIWPIDGILSGATTRSQSEPGSDGNEGVLHISQSSSITGTSPSDFLMSYPGQSLGGGYPSVEMQSVYSTAPANWAIPTFVYSYANYTCQVRLKENGPVFGIYMVPGYFTLSLCILKIRV